MKKTSLSLVFSLNASHFCIATEFLDVAMVWEMDVRRFHIFYEHSPISIPGFINFAERGIYKWLTF